MINKLQNVAKQEKRKMTRNEFTAKELWLTTSDASRLLNINARSIRKLVEAGRIQSASTGGKYLVRVDNFDSRKRTIV
ncbi:MAG: helix-turn-helix domain-containing protein [Nanoarchaeota archaeon]|nr:helix-turn-helix domain-containing protein [Nanoarchaeota archaeon]